jgi:hypothetical protein
MEKIVYFTGAGFSAPLGLPVMGNFYFKSQDMYSANPEKYKHFKEIFDEIQRISVTKNYYSSDLFNVEEILSILEMRAQLEGSKLKEAFVRYLCDVVEFHTPELKPYGLIPGNWHNFLFGHPNSVYRGIATFVANTFNLTINQTEHTLSPPDRFLMGRREADGCRYSIVTVNYDRVIEQVIDYWNANFGRLDGGPITFTELNDVEKNAWNLPALVKLHGSVDSGTVVPPTWSKGVYEEILLAWRSAHALLREATQIRILGYSLPVADANVKYLLKSSVTESTKLKAIDVICWDPDGTVRGRYKSFVEFRDLRFRSAKLEDYFGAVIKAIGEPSRLSMKQMVFDHLEGAHSRFMESGSQ